MLPIDNNELTDNAKARSNCGDITRQYLRVDSIRVGERSCECWGDVGYSCEGR